jgi:hypothetical protein
MPARTRALGELLRGLIDYAGLFPPSAHTMSDTTARYASYRRGPDAAALGRLVLPAARLAEWAQTAASLPADRRCEGCWQITALVTMPPSHDLRVVAEFNGRDSTRHDLHARVDAVEVKVTSAGEIGPIAAELPPGLEAFYECAPGPDTPALVAEIARVGGAAKIRTGGLVPSAVAAPETVAAFLAGCVAAAVPFKATAGLHHPVRALQALTYEPDSPRAETNGFLNVFVAAVLARARRLDGPALLPIIEETSPDAFVFSDDRLAWRQLSATVEQVREARNLARSFGSCSFDEPIADLKTLHAYL